MSRADRESLARLSAINRDLGVISQDVHRLLLRIAGQRTSGKLTTGGLRAIGHKLVTLAGDLTTLGVDMAHWADEMDQANE